MTLGILNIFHLAHKWGEVGVGANGFCHPLTPLSTNLIESKWVYSGDNFFHELNLTSTHQKTLMQNVGTTWIL